MATDWQALLPTLKADRDAGMGVVDIARKHGLPKGSVSRWLAKGKPESVKPETGDSPETLDGSRPTVFQDEAGKKRGKQALPEPSSLSIDKATARLKMNEAIAGRIKLDAVQAGLIKTALKDELEPEVERNPYAGTPEDELAERALVLACSVLGVKSIAARLALMLKHEPGMLDLLGDEDAIPQEAQELDSPVVTTTDDEGPQSNVLEAAKQLPRNLESDVLVERRARNSTVKVEDVESLDTSGGVEGK